MITSKVKSLFLLISFILINSCENKVENNKFKFRTSFNTDYLNSNVHISYDNDYVYFTGDLILSYDTSLSTSGTSLSTHLDIRKENWDNNFTTAGESRPRKYFRGELDIGGTLNGDNVFYTAWATDVVTSDNSITKNLNARLPRYTTDQNGTTLTLSDVSSIEGVESVSLLSSLYRERFYSYSTTYGGQNGSVYLGMPDDNYDLVTYVWVGGIQTGNISDVQYNKDFTLTNDLKELSYITLPNSSIGSGEYLKAYAQTGTYRSGLYEVELSVYDNSGNKSFIYISNETITSHEINFNLDNVPPGEYETSIYQYEFDSNNNKIIGQRTSAIFKVNFLNAPTSSLQNDFLVTGTSNNYYWNSVLNATIYTIRVTPVGPGIGTQQSTINDNITISYLEPGVYQWEVRAGNFYQAQSQYSELKTIYYQQDFLDATLFGNTSYFVDYGDDLNTYWNVNGIYGIPGYTYKWYKISNGNRIFIKDGSYIPHNYLFIKNSFSHEFEVDITDSYGTIITKTYYLNVTIGEGF